MPHPVQVKYDAEPFSISWNKVTNKLILIILHFEISDG
jgi:hypothetical protein